MDAVALQALWEQHPFGSARQTQAGDVCEEQKMVFWLIVLERGEKGGSLRSRKRSRGCVRKLMLSKHEGKTEFQKKLNEEKNSLQRQLREIEKFAKMDPAFRNKQKDV